MDVTLDGRKSLACLVIVVPTFNTPAFHETLVKVASFCESSPFTSSTHPLFNLAWFCLSIKSSRVSIPIFYLCFGVFLFFCFFVLFFVGGGLRSESLVEMGRE